MLVKFQQESSTPQHSKRHRQQMTGEANLMLIHADKAEISTRRTDRQTDGFSALYLYIYIYIYIYHQIYT